MTMTIDLENPRSAKALAIAAGAAQWLTLRTRDGQRAYGVPSQRKEGLYYTVTTSSCDCEDAQRHLELVCKHRQALQIHVSLVDQDLRRRGAQSRAHAVSAALAERLSQVEVKDDADELLAETSAASYDDIFARFGGD